jgi:hypothetical protein
MTAVPGKGIALPVLLALAAASALIVAAAPAPAAAAAVPARAFGPARVPTNASELNLSKAICGAAGTANQAIGIACRGLAGNGGALINGGKQLITGNVGGAASTVLGAGAGTLATEGATVGLAAISASVVAAAGAVLHQTAAALGSTTAPQLQSTWFSATYWRMAAIAAMLTLPFLFAATVQAALRSDVTLLARAALGYLPLAILSIAIAAPLTTLLLAASDELCGLISAAAANESSHVLASAVVLVGGLTALGQSPFLAFLLGMFAIVAAFALWIELLLREAAVYVVVLMLPLAFAALAWPARRIWAVRAVEILVALILSKFAIVAVLSLGGAAIAASIGHQDVSGLMAGTVLIMLAALSPWALLRFVPLAEVTAGAAAALRGELRSAGASADRAVGYATGGDDGVARTIAWMSRQAGNRMPEPDDPASPGGGGGGTGPGAGGGTDPGASGGTDRGPGGAGAGEIPRETSRAAPEPEAEQPPETPDPPWQKRSVLELGPNFGDTPVWPHPDAE